MPQWARTARRLPREAFHIARLAATLAEDCGACVQIIVNVAQLEQVSASILNAALRQDLEALPPELADVFRFAQTVARGGDDLELRVKLRTLHGEEGLVELALAIAAARVLPTVKRALGHAQSCSIVRPEVLRRNGRIEHDARSQPKRLNTVLNHQPFDRNKNDH